MARGSCDLQALGGGYRSQVDACVSATHPGLKRSSPISMASRWTSDALALVA
jgi:hypothetical protein